MHCNKCGTENRDGARFCRGCGAPLGRRGPGRRKLAIVAFLAVAMLAAAIVAVMVVSARNKNGGLASPRDAEEVLSSLAELNGGELPDIYFDPDDGTPRFIAGRYTDRAIGSAEDAVASLGNVAAIYGIAYPQGEFAVAKVNELDGGTVYRLQQYHDGVEVFGNQLVVSCDAEGRTESLSGCYLGDIDIDLPDSSEVDDGMVLAIWDGADGPQAVLKWEDATGVTLYSAETGEVVYSQSFVEEASEDFDIEVNGEDLSFTVEGDGGTSHSLRDASRNLVVFDAEGRELTYQRYIRDGAVLCGTYGKKLKWYGGTIKKGTKLDRNDVVKDSDGTYTAKKGEVTVAGLACETLLDVGNEGFIWLDDDVEGISDAAEQSEFIWYAGGSAVSGIKALSHVAKTYDFYRNRCGGWLGYDGRNGLFRIVVNNKMGGESNAWSWGNLITFSESMGVRAPVVAHEYTHSVMGEVSGQLLDLPGTGSLKEAYADVMAAVIMEPETWDLGARNLADPSATDNPSVYQGRYWQDSDSSEDGYGSHQNSTVISHAAYLMHEKGLSADLVGRIWFRSMGYLDLRSDFYTCRYAVLAAARSIGCGSKVEGIIREAFDEVGIMRFDVSAMRVRPNAKVYVEDANGERIREFELKLRYAGGEFGSFRGEVACSASTDGGCVDMASDFGGEPLIGRYFFDVSSKDAAQAYGPVISVEMDGVGELVITLPILVVYLDDDARNKEAEQAAINFIQEWYDDWSFEDGSFMQNEKQIVQRCLPLIAEGSTLYDEFSESYNSSDGGAYFRNFATSLVSVPTAIKLSETSYRVSVSYYATQNSVNQTMYDEMRSERGYMDTWDVTVDAGGKITALEWTPDSTDPHTVHFNGADFLLPEAWWGKVDPVVIGEWGTYDEWIMRDGATLLVWNYATAERFAQMRAKGESPSPSHQEVGTETLPDGTKLIFSTGEDTVHYVEIENTSGRLGCLWTFAPSDYWGNDPEAIASFRKLQAEAAGVSADGDPHEIAIAYLRECAKRLTMTGGRESDGSAGQGASGGALSSDELVTRIEQLSSKKVVWRETRDYDSSGDDETFVIVGSLVEGSSDSDPAWEDAELWFVSTSGEALKVAGDETFDAYLRVNDVIGSDVTGGQHTLLSLEKTAFGSGGSAHVFTVLNGRPAKVAFGSTVLDGVRSKDGGIVGTKHIYESGHTRQDYWMTYDESTNQLECGDKRGSEW